jgi:Cu+-exporting ATPase
MRIFSKNNFFLKNANVIERLGDADTIVFDKTGTLTSSSQSSIQFNGKVLSYDEAMMIKSITAQSNHPLSKSLTAWSDWNDFAETSSISSYQEIPGKGIQAVIDNNLIKIGSHEFISKDSDIPMSLNNDGAIIHISINNIYKGNFTLKHNYREGVFDSINILKNKIPNIHVLSGDNNKEEKNISALLGNTATLIFNQSPQEKLDYINNLQQQGKKVIMVGDGLNDAGALQQSNVGIAVTDNTNHFTPACDAILAGKEMKQLHKLFSLAKKGRTIVSISFAISIAYNIIGLSFATQALLSPLIAAILMPASSISIILLVTLFGGFYAKKLGLVIGD